MKSKEPTAKEVAEYRAMMSKITQYNGNIAYCRFRGGDYNTNTPKVYIESISAANQNDLKFVGFIDPALIGSTSAND